MGQTLDLESWLRQTCSSYQFDGLGIFRSAGDHAWPLTAQDGNDLHQQLAAGGHLMPLPRESAALANVLEVSLVDFLLDELDKIPGVLATRGSERGYPDLEVSGAAFGGGFHAVDIKAARRKALKKGFSKNTNSRITLYTGNTYFMYPELHWPGSPRPFDDYSSHLDLIAIYTLDESAAARVADLELVVQQPWKIASRTRSSTTREYIGAVMEIEALRDGRGEFATEAEFYRYWKKFPFKIGKAVQQQLRKLLAEQQLKP